MSGILPISARMLNVLRTIASLPNGMPLSVSPISAACLAEMGLIEIRETYRTTKGVKRVWLLTAEGQRAMRAYGTEGGGQF